MKFLWMLFFLVAFVGAIPISSGNEMTVSNVDSKEEGSGLLYTTEGSLPKNVASVIEGSSTTTSVVSSTASAVSVVSEGTGAAISTTVLPSKATDSSTVTVTESTTISTTPATSEAVYTTITADDISKLNFTNAEVLNGTTIQNRNSLKEEIRFFEEQFVKVKEDIAHWMESSFHRNVILPAIIGVSSGLLTILLYVILRKCCQSLNKKSGRTFMSRRQNSRNDKKTLLERKFDSEDDL